MPQTDSRRALENVLRNPAIWRAEQTHARYPGIATAFPALDQALPDAGWPVGVLTELLTRETGAGELSLLLPALRAICAEERGIALLGPPCLPHARAWEAAGIPLERLLVVDSDGVDLLWAAEQVLRSGECGAVLVWGQAAGSALNHRALQRLHLAAGAGNALCFLYRATGAQDAPSPAPLRIRLAAHAGALHLHLVKCRGAMRAKPIRIELFPAHWQRSPVQVLPATSPVANADLTPASAATQQHAIDAQTSFEALLAATSDLSAATADLLACSIATSPECAPVPAAASRNTIDTQAPPEPAFAAVAPQRTAGSAAIASGSAPLSEATPFPAVHSRTSIA